MALLNITKCWVGVQRRADAAGLRADFYPTAYVRVDLEGTVLNIRPGDARTLAKALNASASLINPPKPRVKRS